VSAAVVASFLGIGGTLVGAALGSIVASIGGALYSHSFQRAGYRLGETKVLAVVTSRRGDEPDPGPADVPVIEADADHPPYAETAPVEEAEGLPQPGPLPPPGGRVPRRLSWKGALALTCVAFLVALAAIQSVELLIGRPLSGGSGGTTISHLVSPKSGTHKTPEPASSPGSTLTSTPTSTPTGVPTGTPTSAPTGTPTQTGTPTTTPPGAPAATPTG
jgi:hypothetical protein